MTELLSSASLEELKQGYKETDEAFTCLCCGRPFEKGLIYQEDGLLYEAWRYIRLHIAKEHGSVFAYLVGLDKGATGLSDLQRNLLSLFYQGKSDTEVQQALGTGSTSTIRNHRFLLRERERQARLFLALMELLRERDGEPAAEAAPTKAPTGLQKYFPFGVDGPLQTLSIPAKQRQLVLGEVAKRFEGGRRYSEAEVNRVLEPVHDDYVTLRRYLVDYGFLERLPDGGQYWRRDSELTEGTKSVDRRKELQQQAKEIKVEAGVYQIKNTRNGKVMVESTRDLKTMQGRRFALELNSHPNKTLQREWNEFGADAFTFEVLEVLKKPETGYFDEVGALKKLKRKWLEQLQPFGEKGYNAPGDLK